MTSNSGWSRRPRKTGCGRKATLGNTCHVYRVQVQPSIHSIWQTRPPHSSRSPASPRCHSWPHPSGRNSRSRGDQAKASGHWTAQQGKPRLAAGFRASGPRKEEHANGSTGPQLAARMGRSAGLYTAAQTVGWRTITGRKFAVSHQGHQVPTCREGPTPMNSSRTRVIGLPMVTRTIGTSEAGGLCIFCGCIVATANELNSP